MPKRKRSSKKISGFGALKKESQSKSTQNLRNNQLKENEAMSCIQKGNINEAEKIYLELIERETQSHIVYGNLAAIYQMRGNKEKEQIIYLLKKALQLKPEFPDALINLGKYFSTLSAPNLEINVSLPDSLSGFKILHRFISSSGFKVGPHFRPRGFLIPLQNSTCAPSGCLVLSPIHTKCAEVS